MGYNSKYTGAEVEGLLDRAKNAAIASYIIRSFNLQMLSDVSGEIEVIRVEQYNDLISDAIRKGQRILVAAGNANNGFEGWVDTNAYQEDMIYLDFYHMGYLYHIEIGSRTAIYTKKYINDYVRDIAATVVEEAIPTEIATATQRRDMRDNITPVRLLSPNIMYDWSGISKETLLIPNLGSGNTSYDNKWMVRFSMISSDGLTIPFDVMWKDGIAPSWSEWCTCEITFTKDGIERVLGEWKIYK